MIFKSDRLKRKSLFSSWFLKLITAHSNPFANFVILNITDISKMFHTFNTKSIFIKMNLALNA